MGGVCRTSRNIRSISLKAAACLNLALDYIVAASWPNFERRADVQVGTKVHLMIKLKSVYIVARSKIAFPLANNHVLYINCCENYDDSRASFVHNQSAVFVEDNKFEFGNRDDVCVSQCCFKSSELRNTAIQRDDSGIFIRVTGHATHDPR